ncbi:MAG TPA: hypothetical protein VF307_04940 [Candidatus Nanopelagicaceae bacterium]
MALRAAKSPLRVRDLSDGMRLHENTIREHLEGLVASAYAERVQLLASGRGRPSFGYQARKDFEAAVDPQTRDYANLALVLAKQLGAIGGNTRRAAISAGEKWAELFFTSQEEPEKINGRQRVYEVLKSLGYSPRANAKRKVIHLQTCPLLAAAKLEPEIICSVHLGLVRGLITQAGEDCDEVELAPFAQPGSCRLTLP